MGRGSCLFVTSDSYWISPTGTVTSGARIIGDIFNEAKPGSIEKGLEIIVRTWRQIDLPGRKRVNGLGILEVGQRVATFNAFTFDSSRYLWLSPQAAYSHERKLRGFSFDISGDFRLDTVLTEGLSRDNWVFQPQLDEP